ncbi:hypothetical protein [Bosea sp. (in: a-proteobacteria)]
MSNSDEAKRIARQDRIARGEARRARMEREAARAQAQAQAIRAEELRLLSEVGAAKRTGLIKTLPKVRKVQPAKPGNLPVIGERIVPDPLHPGDRTVATVNLAEHPLEMMLSRKRLDQALYEAGVRYRAIYERAVIGPGRGIDPGKVKVDGGKLGDPLSDDVAGAHLELKRLSRVVGMVGERILSEVAGRGVTIADLAMSWPGSERERSKRDYLMLRFKEALDVLATEVWGARGPASARIVGARDLGGEAYDEAAVATANQRFLNRRGIVGFG